MSYPPQPGQDPNNPYANPPQQPQQPGYGYPQQGQQPAYGYPQQQPGLPSYGGPADPGYMGAGYGGPMAMPGTVNAAKILMFVTGGLSAVGAILMFFAAAAIGSLSADNPELQNNADFEMLSGMGMGVLILIGVVYLALAVGGIVLAAKFSKGGSGLRTGTIVWGAVVILMGVIGIPVGLLFVILGVLVVVFAAKSDGKAWFNRAQY